MKTPEKPQSAGGNLLEFPLHKTLARGIELPDIPLTPLEIEYPIEQKRPLDTSFFASSSNEEVAPPPFVVKMREINSITEQIEYSQKMLKELSYYLDEIEQYLPGKNPSHC